jgi:hypothetical protein
VVCLRIVQHRISMNLIILPFDNIRNISLRIQGPPLWPKHMKMNILCREASSLIVNYCYLSSCIEKLVAVKEGEYFDDTILNIYILDIYTYLFQKYSTLLLPNLWMIYLSNLSILSVTWWRLLKKRVVRTKFDIYVLCFDIYVLCFDIYVLCFDIYVLCL